VVCCLSFETKGKAELHIARPLPFYWQVLEEDMDKDRLVGSAKEIKGAVKQAVGNAVGDAKLVSDGKADKIEGKIQNAIGGLKDTLKGK
jgi:uncharacterized protein YjbJ (UPF0337 family)